MAVALERGLSWWRRADEWPGTKRGRDGFSGPSLVHSAVCGLLPTSSSPPSPTHAQNSDIKAARPIHSLFRWHKNHYKNFTKDP